MMTFINPINNIIRLKRSDDHTLLGTHSVTKSYKNEIKPVSILEPNHTNSYIHDYGENNTLGDHIEHCHIEGENNKLEGKNHYINIKGAGNSVGKGCRYVSVHGESNSIKEMRYYSTVSGYGAIVTNSGENTIGTSFGSKEKHKNGKSQLSRILLCTTVKDNDMNTLTSYYDYRSSDIITLPKNDVVAHVKLEFIIRGESNNASGSANNMLIIDSNGLSTWNAAKFKINYVVNTFKEDISIIGVDLVGTERGAKIKIINKEGNGKLDVLCELTFLSLSA